MLKKFILSITIILSKVLIICIWRESNTKYIDIESRPYFLR